MTTKKSLLVMMAYGLLLSIVLLFPLNGCAFFGGPPLPPLVIPVPPPVLLIPGTYAYFAPDVSDDLIFFAGFWYRPFREGWYRASYYNGPWTFVPRDSVPGVLVNLQPGFRNVPSESPRIPYDELQMNWRNWEREKHWDKPLKPAKVSKPAKKKSKAGRRSDRKAGKGQGTGKGRGR
jgi:hypothetical protein